MFSISLNHQIHVGYLENMFDVFNPVQCFRDKKFKKFTYTLKKRTKKVANNSGI